MDLGVLLSLPVESIAIRAALAMLAAVALVRLLLRSGLRSPRARVATALAPAAALVAVVVLSGPSLQPPLLMLPVEGANALPIPVRNGFMHFAPIAVPLLVGLWGAVALLRLSRRAIVLQRARRRALIAATTTPVPAHVVRKVHAVAGSIGVAAVPTAALVPSCPGGAFVVGSRRPIVVVGQDLLDHLDDAELEGVLAHELAHVKRRDNVVAGIVGALRDLTFFVPGSGWAVRQLHRERELAADQLAVSATGRPGALAGGLLKVLEGAPDHGYACATLAPSGTLVDRVRVLVEDAPPPSFVRRGSETVAVAAVVAIATAAALVVPTVVAGPDREREAVALVWSTTATPNPDTPLPVGEARAFDVYRRAKIVASEPAVVAHPQIDEQSQEYRRGSLHACAAEGGTCPVPERRVGLGLRSQPTITVDDALMNRWKAKPVTGNDSTDGFRVYWLARVE